MFSGAAQHPAKQRTHQKRDCRQSCRQPERRKGGAGQVKEVRHGERVSGNGPMSQQGTDVIDVGNATGDPESPAQHCSDHHTQNGEEGMCATQP